MIAVSSEGGNLIRLLSAKAGDGSASSSIFGFHPVFGFISQEAVVGRLHARKGKGLRTRESWKCQFEHDGSGLRAVSNCQIRKIGDDSWTLITEFGNFVLSEIKDFGQTSGFGSLQNRALFKTVDPDNHLFQKSLGIAVLAVLTLFLVLPKHAPEIELPTMSEPIEVKLAPEVQKSVRVPDTGLALPQQLTHQMNHKAKVAVAQNLGFLSMLGKKNLTKALGGMPTMPGASAGAGAGGKQGSGGELLVGLGEGVKRTTVGNTGVAGLGGIGTKGAGGGAGGYGTSYVGSGNGRGLSSIPLSQDMILEGGLDRSVIQATIAKYLNQVRACYEAGLQRTPGLIGQVSILFQIGGSGAVTSSAVSKSSLGDSEVEQCVAHKVMTWQFPKPRGGVNVKVNYPFMLRPVKS
jgi:hypothetical protein